MTASFKDRILAPDKVSQDQFGYSVAKRATWAAIATRPQVVGDPNDGDVYLHQSIAGTWTYKQKITIASSVNFNSCLSVAIDSTETWLAIGSTVLGEVYLYKRSGVVWNWVQTLPTPAPYPPDFHAIGGFGTSVSLSTKLLLVGAPQAYGQWQHAFIFTETGDVWTLQQPIPPPDGWMDIANYGISTSIDETSISGDPITGTARVFVSNSGHGSHSAHVHVWKRTAGVWTRTYRISEVQAYYEDFGNSISADNDTLVIGTIGDSAHVSHTYSFLHDGAENWNLSQTFTSPLEPTNANYGFGYSVFTKNSLLVIGSPVESITGPGSVEGRAYTYDGTPDISGYGLSWAYSTDIQASILDSNQKFGWAVSVTDSEYLIGARNDTDGATHYGAAYIFISGAPPVADFIGSPQGLYISSSVTFTDLSTNTPTSWSYDFGDGFTSALQNPIHLYSTQGIYTVVLTATNSSGSDTITKIAYINVYSIVPYPSISPVNEELTVIDFPVRFKENCDVVLTNVEQGLRNNIRNSVMIMQKGLPLFTSFGSRVIQAAFDPDDPAMQSFLAQEVSRAVAIGEPRVIIDPSFRKSDTTNNNKVSFVFPYRQKTIDKWKFVNIDIPTQKDIDK
jgi:PKD repeat protein